jgi:hypothetical protein
MAMALLVTACGTDTMITGSWRKPNASADRYRNIFVAAITSNVAAKQAVENGLQNILQQKGITVEKSMDVFPPNFSTQTDQQKDLLIGTIRQTHADGILTISLIRQENESHYVPGSGGYWDPGLRFGYYNRFSDYYFNRYPYLYSPGYYDVDKVYYLETNFYNARTEALIWAAQSKTYNPASIDDFLKGYVKTIFDQMVKDGLISPNNRLVAGNQSE